MTSQCRGFCVIFYVLVIALVNRAASQFPAFFGRGALPFPGLRIAPSVNNPGLANAQPYKRGSHCFPEPQLNNQVNNPGDRLLPPGVNRCCRRFADDFIERHTNIWKHLPPNDFDETGAPWYIVQRRQFWRYMCYRYREAGYKLPVRDAGSVQQNTATESAINTNTKPISGSTTEKSLNPFRPENGGVLLQITGATESPQSGLIVTEPTLSSTTKKSQSPVRNDDSGSLQQNSGSEFAHSGFIATAPPSNFEVTEPPSDSTTTLRELIELSQSRLTVTEAIWKPPPKTTTEPPWIPITKPRTTQPPFFDPLVDETDLPPNTDDPEDSAVPSRVLASATGTARVSGSGQATSINQANTMGDLFGRLKNCQICNVIVTYRLPEPVNGTLASV